ncbi:MAG: 16S rRNA processing protein RimM [Paludibacteraceae bacterium]|nr:16S rRNA processing protein RimM [Paludibacteraceae bacterium]
MIRLEELIEIGKISKTHGTRGEVVCNINADLLETADPDYLILSIDNLFVPFFIEEYRYKTDNSIILLLTDVSNSAAAQNLVGSSLYIELKQLPEDYQIEPQFGNLIGYKVEDNNKGLLGIIEAIDTTTINTLVQLDNGIVLPLHEDFIESADSKNHVLVLNLPQGLI